MREKIISVPVHGYKGYLWSVDDAIRIGRDFHLVGVAVGGISEFPNQYHVYGMPIQVGQQNIILSTRKGWVRTLRYESKTVIKNESLFDSIFTENLKSSLYTKTTNNIYDMFGYQNLEINRKRSKLKKSVITTTNSLALFEIHKKTLIGEKFTEKYSSIPLSTTKITNKSNDLIWPLFLTAFQRAHYAVVHDLHSQGYWISEGVKFGGEFLAYPGDLELFHAQFVVRVLRKDLRMIPCIFTAHVRCSHTTHKKLLIGTTNEKCIPFGRNKSHHTYNLRMHKIQKTFDHKSNYLNKSIRLVQMGNHIIAIEYITAFAFRNSREKVTL